MWKINNKYIRVASPLRNVCTWNWWWNYLSSLFVSTSTYINIISPCAQVNNMYTNEYIYLYSKGQLSSSMDVQFNVWINKRIRTRLGLRSNVYETTWCRQIICSQFLPLELSDYAINFFMLTAVLFWTKHSSKALISNGLTWINKQKIKQRK